MEAAIAGRSAHLGGRIEFGAAAAAAAQIHMQEAVVEDASKAQPARPAQEGKGEKKRKRKLLR